VTIVGHDKEWRRLLEAAREGCLTRREFVRRSLALGWGSQTALLLAACGRRDEGGPPVDDTSSTPALGPIEQELHIYNWGDYIPEETVPDFEKEFGVKVTYDTYESNEEMLLNLSAGVKGYDLVVPTGWQVDAMTKLGLLRPLSRQYLTNWGNLSSQFLAPPPNPAMHYAAPYLWGITGIAYRRDKLSRPVESWATFLDPRYEGRMTMLNERREVIGAMLRYRGHSLNSIDPAQLAGAQADGIRAKRNLRAYLSVEVRPYLLSGDVWVVQFYDGAARRLTKLDPAIAFVIPQEGCTIYCDFMCIPRSAQNPRAAHEFINYLLRPEIGARLAERNGYGSPNVAATRLINDPVPYPTEAEFRRLEYQVDLGESNTMWDRVWEEIRSA
jgi:spermidine/putrescine transport system substrate-binding protein